MPTDIKDLRERSPTTNGLNGEAKEILDFLGNEKGKAYTFQEITENLVNVHGTQAFMPWSPLLAGMHATHLAAVLDQLNRSGQVIQVRNGTQAWYHLPE